jgi:DNA-binding transcriptional LysR family regulator
MGALVLDLDLLRSFVSVVDAGGFTRAGERVHRTQSTVSQQIGGWRRPWAACCCTGPESTQPRPRRESGSSPMRGGSLRSPRKPETSLRGQRVTASYGLGFPRTLPPIGLTRLLSRFARSRPGLRLDVRCDLSVKLRSDLERGELDLALMKRDAGGTGAIAVWPEDLHWVTSRGHPIDPRRDPLPLAVFPQGCLYRNRAIHSLEAAGRAWHIAYTSPNLAGVQAAVSAGLGVSILSGRRDPC